MKEQHISVPLINYSEIMMFLEQMSFVQQSLHYINTGIIRGDIDEYEEQITSMITLLEDIIQTQSVDIRKSLDDLLIAHYSKK